MTSQLHKKVVVVAILLACIILHIMSVEDGGYLPDEDSDYAGSNFIKNRQVSCHIWGALRRATGHMQPLNRSMAAL